MTYNFANKRALVTGAGQGIGRATCIQLAEYGAKVTALSRTQSHLDSLKALVPSIEIVCVDLADWNATRKAVEAAGDFQLLVNNAGIAKPQSFLHTDPDTLEMIMNINFKSMVNVSQVVAKSMIARKVPGSIVNVSSIAAEKAMVDHTAYSASKAAMDVTTKIMALELGQHKIRVNSVNPTVVFTEMGQKNWSDPKKLEPLLSRIPLGRVAEVEDVVNAIMFLLSNQSDFITGVCLPIEGGSNVVGTITPQAAASSSS